MVNDLKELSYPSDMISIDFHKVQQIFIERNIIFYHLMKNPHVILKVPKTFEIESDNTYWGAQNCSCSMGAFSYTGSSLSFGIKVGRYSSIAHSVTVMGAEHFPHWISTSPVFYENDYHSLDASDITNNMRQGRKINIGSDVWIGANVTLKPNISIGNGAIIASNSVVTKDVPPFAIVGGVPAKIIRYRFSEGLIDKIKKIAWWKYHKESFKGMIANDPEYFIEILERKINDGEIKEYSPEILTVEKLLGN